MRALASAARRATGSRFVTAPAVTRGYATSSDDEPLNRRPQNPEKGFTAALFPGDGEWRRRGGVEWGRWQGEAAPSPPAGGRPGRNSGREGNRAPAATRSRLPPPPPPLQASALKSRKR